MKGIRRHVNYYPSYPYGYPYGYGYDPYYSYARAYREPPMYVIKDSSDDDDDDSSFPKIHWPTLGVTLAIGAFLWGMR